MMAHDNCFPPPQAQSHRCFFVKVRANKALRGGYSCVEVLAAQFVILIPLIAGLLFARKWGNSWGIAAGSITALSAVSVVLALYRWGSRIQKREAQELSEKYPSIFRVLSLPKESPCVMAEELAIVVGDYGWEAEPIVCDGLIYLQGLNENWEVVWYAGFDPQRVELIGPKPRSQYWLPHLSAAGLASFQKCPYPVIHSLANTLGLPRRVDFPFVQGVRVKLPVPQALKGSGGMNN